jgi:hypothetical protein
LQFIGVNTRVRGHLLSLSQYADDTDAFPGPHLLPLFKTSMQIFVPLKPSLKAVLTCIINDSWISKSILFGDDESGLLEVVLFSM